MAKHRPTGKVGQPGQAAKPAKDRSCGLLARNQPANAASRPKWPRTGQQVNSANLKPVNFHTMQLQTTKIVCYQMS